MSIYSGELTTECVLKQVSRLKKAFPGIPVEFYDILTDRLKECNFNDKRLIDSVNNVIDNCKYPIPTIADFISFDKLVKLYNYEAMCKKVSEWGIKVWKEYKKIKVKDKMYWYDLSEINQ